MVDNKTQIITSETFKQFSIPSKSNNSINNDMPPKENKIPQCINLVPKVQN